MVTMTWIQRYTLPLLVGILAFAFLTRMFNLHLPERYVFDEVYHGITSKLIARNDLRAYEWWNPPVEPDTAVDWLHPPLAKYTQAASILVFGENSFGWRFSSVIFGVGVIYLVYKLADELFDQPEISLLSATIASLDGLLLVQSRIAMNDIHVTFFILLTLWSYVKFRSNRSPRWMLTTGLATGLSIGSKWSGLFVLGPVWFFEVCHWLSLWINRQRFVFAPAAKHFALCILAWIAVPALIYLLSYSHMFLQGKDLNHLRELHRQIWWYQTTLEATHPYQSRPWQWFLDLRPVWYYVEYGDETIANIYAFGNPVLFWLGNVSLIFNLGFLIMTSLSLLRQFWQRTKKISLSRYFFPLAFVMVSYTAVWIPWQLSPRIMFFYHYTPAVPLLSIILAFWLVRLARFKDFEPYGKMISLTWLGLLGATFVLFYPHWTGLQVSTEFANLVYFAIPSWK